MHMLILSLVQRWGIACVAAGTFATWAGCTANERGPWPSPLNTQAPRNDAAATKPPPETVVVADGTAVPLDKDAVTSYFQQGPAKDAAAAFALEKWQLAHDGFSQALAKLPKKADVTERARLQFMVGLTERYQQKWQAAYDHLNAALPNMPLIADAIHYRLAECAYFLGKLDVAQKHALAIASDSVFTQEAELLRGDILRASPKGADIETHYQNYLNAHPKGMRLAEARFFLAEAQKKNGKNDLAAQNLRKILIEAPLTAWASRAQTLYAEIPGQTLPGEPSTADEFITRGMEYFDAMRNPESEADFIAALAAPGLTAEAKCVASYHRAQSVFKQRNRTRAAPLFDAAGPICEAANNLDLKVKSAYQAGRSYANIGQPTEAVKRYAKAEGYGNTHSFADDARLRQAESFEDAAEKGDSSADGKVDPIYASIPEKYPAGDMKAEALWRLAWRSYKRKEYQKCIDWLKKAVEMVPIDDNYFSEGSAQYWQGRAYGKLGKTEESLAAYAEAIRLYPLSYYSLLALNRLREVSPEAFANMQKEIETLPTGAASEMSFPPRAVYGTPNFARALEYLRLGLGDSAEAELRKLGLTTPSDRKRIDDEARVQDLWAVAFLFDKAGRYGVSHWTTRWHILDYKRHWPVGEFAQKWRISYPTAWWELLARHAKLQNYPPELLIAFVREESAFNPLMESFANAIGLTQMIFPTANRFAKGTGIKVSRETLRDPESNVTIGSRFLGFLVQKFSGRIGLLVPSYNAGEGATFKWLKLRGNWAVDEFAEEIPYDETRNYSKRVIASYFAYSYLRDRTIPAMPNEIPVELIPGQSVKTTAEPEKKMSEAR